MTYYCLQCGTVLEPVFNADPEIHSFNCPNCGFLINLRLQNDSSIPPSNVPTIDPHDPVYKSNVQGHIMIPEQSKKHKKNKQPNNTDGLKTDFHIGDVKLIMGEALMAIIIEFMESPMTYGQMCQNMYTSALYTVVRMKTEFDYELPKEFLL